MTQLKVTKLLAWWIQQQRKMKALCPERNRKRVNSIKPVKEMKLNEIYRNIHKDENELHADIDGGHSITDSTTQENEAPVPKKKHKKKNKQKSKSDEPESIIHTDSNFSDQKRPGSKDGKCTEICGLDHQSASKEDETECVRGGGICGNIHEDYNKLNTDLDETISKSKKKKKKHRKDKRETDKTQFNGENFVLAVDNNTKAKRNKKNKFEKSNSVDLKNTKELKEDQNTDFKDLAGVQDKDKEEISAAKTQTNNYQGQWHTADFQDTERQNKFIRLLGGQRHGADTKQLKTKFQLVAECRASSEEQGKSDIPSKPNLAMNKTQERLYQIALENQYEKALSSNKNRGVGLEFQVQDKVSKKFHIDIASSKSIKFDD